MKTVTVNASQTYEVKVGRGLLADLGKEIAPRMGKGRAVCLVSDSNVANLYLDAAQVVRASTIDGVHLEAESHARLARAVYQKLKDEKIVL